MPDNDNGGDPNQINNPATPPGNDPTKTDKGGAKNDKGQPNGEKPFDENVFDDPRLWTHPRFKNLNERAKKADDLEKAQKDAEDKRLADTKQFEELANKRSIEVKELQGTITQAKQDNRIITEAAKIGVVDVEAVLKLVDRSNIRIDDTGAVHGALEALQALITAKPYLKGKAGGNPIGSPSSPGADADNQAQSFKLSQLQNPVFYREHEKEIMEAYKLGKIEDDMTR